MFLDGGLIEFRSSERRRMGGWRENYKHLTSNGVKSAVEPLRLDRRFELAIRKFA